MSEDVSNAKPAPRSGWISISNGLEFSLIKASQLGEARKAGFYRPESHGKTIVSKDGRLFEVPLERREQAQQAGFEDVLLRQQDIAKLKAKQPEPRSPEADSAPSLEQLLPSSVGEPKHDSTVEVASDQDSNPSADDIQRDNLLLVVADAVEKVEREAEQARRNREAAIKAAHGIRRPWLRFRYWFADRHKMLLERLGTNAISVLVHVAILLVLSSLFLVSEEEKHGVLIVASPNHEQLLVEEMQIETEPLELTEPSESAPAENTPVEEVAMEVTELAESPNFLASVKGDAIKPPTPEAKPVKDPGDGQGKKLAKPTFFGSSFTARDFVFVIDNSNSMTKGRFETALLQLMLTVKQLTPKQRFYVIFYSDTAYGMMHPKPLGQLMPATLRNKLGLEQWLGTIQLCLRTNGKEAIELAFKLDPDVVYVLGDGAFTDGAARHFVKNPHPSIVVHTRGMEVSAKNAVDFQKLAKAHRGTYKDVGVMPEGALLAKQFPRPRNRIRGPVWGVKLPPMLNK